MILIGCGGGGGSSSSSEGGSGSSPSGETSSDPALALTTTSYSTPENSADGVVLSSNTSGTVYTLTGGDDAARFTLDSSTGALTFTTVPDFENPQDSDGNNEYKLIVRLEAGTASMTSDVVVLVEDVDESGGSTGGGSEGGGSGSGGSGGSAVADGPDPDVSVVVEIPVWDERPDVTIPEPSDPVESGSFTYLGDRLALPDGLTIADVFVDGIRLKQNYKIVASTNAVTVDEYTGKNQNSQDAGRYLIAGNTDIEQQALISFDRNAIFSAFGGESSFNAKRSKISRVELYLWSESGTEAELEIKQLTYALSEESALWKHNWGLNTITTKHYYSDPMWYKVEIPVETLLFWMNNPAAIPGFTIQAAESTGNGHYVRFSSDETSRPPSLVIHYADAVEAETPVMTALGINLEPHPCEIHYEVSPPNPADGEPVTITATATDNRAMDYIAIKHRDESGKFHTVAYSQTEGAQESVSVSYETIAKLPNLKFAIKADDESGRAHSQYQYVQIPVRNSGSGPEVIVEENPEVTEVYPKSYRFIKADQQKIELSFKASDPDGITKAIVNIGGREFRTFNYDGSDTVVNETMTWQNDPSYTKYNYRVQVFDKSGDFTVIDSPEEYPILDYSQLALYKNALNFPNDRGKDKLTYDPYMFYTYGKRETAPRSIYPNAVLLHAGYVKRIARGGLCYGMSATAIELAKRSHLRVENFKSTAIHPADLTQSNPLVNKYIYTKQASQFSLEGLFIQSLNYFSRLSTSVLSSVDRADYVLNQVKSALNDSPYNLGILSVSQFDLDLSLFEDGRIRLPSGMDSHAIVPWMVRKIGEDEWRIYVYDPNKPKGPKDLQKVVYELDGAGYMTFTNVDLFPYVTIDNDTGKWSYPVNGENWSTLIQYTGSHTVAGGSPANTIDEEHGLYSADYDLPTLGGLLDSVVGGLIRLAAGNSAGTDISIMQNTTSGAASRSAKPPVIIPIPLADSDQDRQQYLLKANNAATLKITGKQTDNYDVSFGIGRATFVIDGKATQKGQSDFVTIDSSMNDNGFKVTMSPGTSDSDFNITAVFTYGKLVAGTIIPASKKYTLTQINMKAGSEMIFDLQAYANMLNISSEKNSVSFNIKVEESLNDAETVEPIYDTHVNVDPQTPFSFNFTSFSTAD